MPYVPVHVLGTGYFGQVRLEHDQALERYCAAKYLNPAYLPSGHEFDEARRMVGFDHDHVVRVHSADLEGGVPVIRMEYLPNGSVEDKFNHQPAPVLEATLMLEDACRGVEALHAGGVLHRDLKPANLLIDANGRIKVSDFGLACPASNPAAGAPYAYPLHLPPEAVGGPQMIVAETGDVFAMGVTAYRIYNGDAMFHSAIPVGVDPTDLIAAGKLPNIKTMQPHIHPTLRKTLAKALYADPTKRFQSIGDLRHALEQSRPFASWARDRTDPDRWDGTDGDGRTYVARITRDGSGNAQFSLAKKVGAGKNFRTVSSDAFEGSEAETEAHAEKVLQNYAKG